MLALKGIVADDAHRRRAAGFDPGQDRVGAGEARQPLGEKRQGLAQGFNHIIGQAIGQIGQTPAGTVSRLNISQGRRRPVGQEIPASCSGAK